MSCDVRGSKLSRHTWRVTCQTWSTIPTAGCCLIIHFFSITLDLRGSSELCHSLQWPPVHFPHTTKTQPPKQKPTDSPVLKQKDSMSFSVRFNSKFNLNGYSEVKLDSAFIKLSIVQRWWNKPRWRCSPQKGKIGHCFPCAVACLQSTSDHTALRLLRKTILSFPLSHLPHLHLAFCLLSSLPTTPSSLTTLSLPFSALPFHHNRSSLCLSTAGPVRVLGNCWAVKLHKLPLLYVWPGNRGRERIREKEMGGGVFYAPTLQPPHSL